MIVVRPDTEDAALPIKSKKGEATNGHAAALVPVTLQPVETSAEPVDLVRAVEALLFVASAPADLNSLARAIGVNEGQVEQAIEILRERLRANGPLDVVQIAQGYQLCTRPEFAESVAAFLKPQRNRLGKSLMEVLAVIAYRQPVTMADIEQVRGVQSDYSVRMLLERKLVCEVGRKHAPGRPLLYGTTQQFLHQFNLNDLSDLPQLDRDVSLNGEASNGHIEVEVAEEPEARDQEE